MSQSVMVRANFDIEVFEKDESFPKESKPDLAQIMKFAYAYRASLMIDAKSIDTIIGLPELRKKPDRPPRLILCLFYGG
jgi:hypothetical protein